MGTLFFRRLVLRLEEPRRTILGMKDRKLEEIAYKVKKLELCR